MLKKRKIMFVSLIICFIFDNLIYTPTPRKRKKSFSIQIRKNFFENQTFTYLKFKDKVYNLF